MIRQVFSLVIEGISSEDFMVSTTNANVLTCPELQTATFDIDVTFDEGFDDTVALTLMRRQKGLRPLLFLVLLLKLPRLF